LPTRHGGKASRRPDGPAQLSTAAHKPGQGVAEPLQFNHLRDAKMTYFFFINNLNIVNH
jgi:hypothetical protein